MMSKKAKIAGPAIAVGAVSAGLVLIGACGIGHHDIYVPPPPLEAGPAAVVENVRDGTGVTTPKVVIPPSPSWQIAPAGPPRRPANYTPPSSTSPESETEPSETSTRPTRTTNPRPGERDPRTGEEPTTSTRTLSIEPTTVAAEEPPPPHTAEADRAPREGEALSSEAAEQLPEIVEPPQPVVTAELAQTTEAHAAPEGTDAGGTAFESGTPALPGTTTQPDAATSTAELGAPARPTTAAQLDAHATDVPRPSSLAVTPTSGVESPVNGTSRATRPGATEPAAR
ncbi:hypothetical protein [Nocardia bovistercoris]|uniref:Uncharacterized protein n=1 Tax=Nocardia bovistercoris TaxID=2785916 RepID=A0A931N2A1_9NOCA|nr:hypothetical protein [Nocardia bovistercoris]MBH0775821.1 hypothetical protein [Nocardia bovistercoris]